MNKVKMFFVAAALLLTTAGVFAGKVKMQSLTDLYYSPSSGVYEDFSIPQSGYFSLTSPGGAQAKIIDSKASSTTYLIYTYVTGTGYKPVYTTF